MSRNATARAAERNYPESDNARPLPGIPAEAIERATHAASAPAPSNDEPAEQPSFFRNLDNFRGMLGVCGNVWDNGALSPGTSFRLAEVERCIYALGGVLEVLHANALAKLEQEDSRQDVPHIGADIADRLHQAAGMLTSRAENAMDWIREDLEKRR